MHRNFYILLLLILITSCQKGWNGHFEKADWYRVKIPCNPELSKEDQTYLFGQTKLDVATCEGKMLEGLVFKVYSGKIKDFQKARADDKDGRNWTYEDMIFKKNPQANGLINDVISSFQLVRKQLAHFELLEIKLVELKGHPGIIYQFANAQTKAICRIEGYWVEDRIYFLLCKGVFDQNMKLKFNDFFDYFQILGKGPYEGESFANMDIPVGRFPNINFHSYAHHPYKPVFRKEIIQTDYGELQQVTKLYVPREKHDLNSLYMHAMGEFDHDLFELDTFDLENFYQIEMKRLSGLRNSTILEYEWMYQSGYLSVKYTEKSRDKEEYCTTIMTLTGNQVYKFQVVTPGKRKINDSMRRFFSSARIRKKK